MTQRGGYYVAQCPAHDDRNASLSISQGDNKAILNCHAGCTYEDVRIALDLSKTATFDNEGKGGGDRSLAADLWMPCQAAKREPGDPEPCSGHKAAEYRYTDEKGNLLYAVARCSRKGDGCPQPFAQWIPDASKRYGKKWGLPSSIRRVLYDLPRVIEAAKAGRRIWFLEGEKDVERMRTDFPGEVATTAPSGAGKSKWRMEYTRYFAGASELIIVADCDKPGLEYAEEVHRHASKVVEKVKVVCTPLMEDGADFSDHRNYGFGLDEFEIVPFEAVERRPRMAIEIEERHRAEPILFTGFDQAKMERSLLGSMIKYGLHYDISEVDIRSGDKLRIAIEAISKIATRDGGGVITPETVAVEIENSGRGAYEPVLAFLLELEKVAFSDTEKPKKAARILRERSIREGIVLACRVIEDHAKNERWEIDEVLSQMRMMADRNMAEYAKLAYSGSIAPSEDAFTGDIVEEVAREEGVTTATTGIVRELRPAPRSESASAVRSG
ncbi:hypothetical protein ACFW2V_12375 [Streptomyces sp. NPDC058947]|uniref:hypothetical protein n=1 Tax=Streptomyces sp. NPDC058947 TaxID=3346675 RepID=UPI00367686A0